MYATLTIEAIDYEQSLLFTPEERYAELTLWAQQIVLNCDAQMSTVVAEFFLGNYIKGDTGQGTTTQIDFTISDWVTIAGGFELSLQHNLDNTVISEIYQNGQEVDMDKIDFNTNTIKLQVPYDFRFDGYAIIKN
jgi:hypothetical protein